MSGSPLGTGFPADKNHNVTAQTKNRYKYAAGFRGSRAANESSSPNIFVAS